MDILTLAVALGYTKKQIEQTKKEGFKVQVEQDRSILETTGEEKVFYFLPKNPQKLKDGYDEFVYANNNWEQVGVTDVDLSSYALKEDIGDLDDLPTTDKSSLVGAISETFTSVSNGKAVVASAITDKGVPTSSDATFSTMAQNIENIPSGGGTLIPKTITENGVYNATDDNADGYDIVTVDVPEKNTLYEYMKNTLETANLGDITEIPANFFRSKTSLINVTMPSVTTIGNNAFQDCTNLLNVIMPNVTNMGNATFQSCANLALTSLPSGVTTIGENCFSRCTKLALTSLPNSVTSIDSGAFQYCTGIQYLDFSEFTTIPTLGTNVFLNTFFPFYFRDQQQLDEWAAATNWSTYADRFQIKPSEVL